MIPRRDRMMHPRGNANPASGIPIPDNIPRSNQSGHIRIGCPRALAACPIVKTLVVCAFPIVKAAADSALVQVLLGQLLTVELSHRIALRLSAKFC